MGFGQVLRENFVGFQLRDERVQDLINQFKFLRIVFSAIFNASDNLFQSLWIKFEADRQHLTDFPYSFLGINIRWYANPVFFVNEQVLVFSKLYFLLLYLSVIEFLKLLYDYVPCWLVF